MFFFICATIAAFTNQVNKKNPIMTPVKRAAFFAGVLVATGWTPPTRAEDNSFVGAEVNYSHDSNFLASPANVPAAPDSSTTFSGYAGHYWPTADLQSAFVLRGEAALVQQNTYTVLDSTDIGASVGYYHAFGPRHVMTVTAGGLERRFSDRSFDSNTESLQLALKQKLSETFWLRESAGVERSDVSTADFSYSGRTLLGSANWGPNRSTLVSLSASVSPRTYDGAPGAARVGREVGAGWLQQFGGTAYVRAAIATQHNEILTGAKYKSTVYSVALGLSM